MNLHVSNSNQTKCQLTEIKMNITVYHSQKVIHVPATSVDSSKLDGRY